MSFKSVFARQVMPLVCFGAAAAFSGNQLRADDGKKPAAEADLRKYDEGPLVPGDFKATPPNPLPDASGMSILAMTFTQIRFTTQYRWAEKRPGDVTVWLTRFDCFSAVDRQKSWNTQPTDLRLLDHEQGHFDLSEINARRGQKKLDKLLAGPGLTGRGRDEKSAAADLNRQVNEQMKEIFDQERADQAEYDRLTRHGREPVPQHDQRAAQRERLKESEGKRSN